MWVGGVRVVITDNEKKVLMLKQRHENREIWMLPGGAIEEGENAIEAAVREVKEETGLDVCVKTLLWHTEEASEERGQRFVNFFLAEKTGGTLSLGMDPERKQDEQVMEEIRFMTEAEMKGIEHLYPEFLKDELWEILLANAEKYNVFKIRRTKQ